MDLNTRPQTNYRGKRGKKNVSTTIFLYPNLFAKIYGSFYIIFLYRKAEKS